MVKRILVTAVICTSVGAIQEVHGQTGITSVPFLRITPDAASSGMGSAGVTSLRGVNGGWYNPSLLGWQSQPKVGLTHANWLPALSLDYYYDHLSAVIPVESIGGVLGGNVTYFNLGGQITRDAQGYTIGSFANYETAVSLSYGRRVGRHWAVGASGSYIHSSLASGLSVNGFQIRPGRSASLSLGVSWRSLRYEFGNSEGQWRAGSSLSHFGAGIKYFDEQTRDPLPMTLRAGIGADLSGGDHRFTVAADVSKLMARTERKIQDGDSSYVAMGPFKALVNSWGTVRVPGPSGGMSELTLGEQLMAGVGVEYGFKELFFARAGYYHEDPANGDRQFVSLGAGVQLA
ncbi:PorV/PorQ family protein, partial [Gracilimonas halophila]